MPIIPEIGNLILERKVLSKGLIAITFLQFTTRIPLMDNVLLMAPVIFALAIGVAVIIYWIGGNISVKGKQEPGKETMYACGEEFPARKLQVNVQRFFIYAVYFLIFDVLAFILATSLLDTGIFPAMYAVIVLLAILILLPLRRWD
ncbi:MAG: NADH-quinone oxidoreductase subunit A [Candidatus Bathyarchaeia archaeon]